MNIPYKLRLYYLSITLTIISISAQPIVAQERSITDTIYRQSSLKGDTTLSKQWHEIRSKTSYYQAFTPPLLHNDGVVDTNIQRAIVTRTRITQELKLDNVTSDTSSYDYLNTALYYAKSADTNATNYHLQKVNVNHIRSLMDVSGLSLYALLKRYNTGNETQNIILEKIKNSPKTPPIYDTFKKYYLRIEALKKQLASTTGDERNDIEKTIKQTDKEQQKKLVEFIAQNGWPSLAEGSIFAYSLALRDVGNSDFYFKHMYDGYKNGDIPKTVLERMKTNVHYLYNHIIIEESEKHQYKKYDITAMKEMYNLKLLADAELTKQVLNVIKNNCPDFVDYFFVIYCNDLKRTGQTIFESLQGNNTECFDLETEIRKVCPDNVSQKHSEYGKHLILPNNNYESDKEFFYIVFKKKE